MTLQRGKALLQHYMMLSGEKSATEDRVTSMYRRRVACLIRSSTKKWKKHVLEEHLNWKSGELEFVVLKEKDLGEDLA